MTLAQRKTALEALSRDPRAAVAGDPSLPLPEGAVSFRVQPEPFSVLIWRLLPDSRQAVSAGYGLARPPRQAVQRYAGDVTQWHRHDYIEMAYVYNGRLTQCIAGRDETFCQGDVCIIDRNSVHLDYLDSDATVYFISMTHDYFDEIFLHGIGEGPLQQFLRTALLDQKKVKQFLHFVPKGEDRLQPLVAALMEELEARQPGLLFMTKALMARMMDAQSRDYALQEPARRRGQDQSLLFHAVEAYLQQHLSSVGLQDLAAQFHFQQDYFTRLIRERTGYTYSQLLQQLRLSQAKELLRTTRLPVWQVSERVGYQNKGYFYRLFEANTGLTPAQYRQQKSE